MKKSLLKALPHLIFASVLLLCFSLIDGVISLTIKDIFDFILDGNIDDFKVSTIRLISISLLLLPINLLLSYARSNYRKKSITSLKFDFINKIFSKNINEFQKENSGNFISSITNDVNTIERSYIEGLLTIIESLIKISIGVALITYVSIWALLGCTIVCLISIVLTHIFNKPIQKHQAERSKLFQGYTSYVKEVLCAFHIIKTNNLDSKINDDYTSKCASVQEKRYILDKIYTYIISLENTAFMLSFIALFFVTGLAAYKDGLSAGSVFLVVITYEKIMNPTMILAGVIPEFLSTKSIFLKMDSSLTDAVNHKELYELDTFESGIELQDVQFSYGSKAVLVNSNLSIKKGEKCLFVGPSGGGKSTLLKLLRKYFPPSSGTILVDGINLNDIKKDSYFSNISNIDQKIFLFEATIRNNITMYKNYSEKEIETAVIRSGLMNFISSLPNGLDTIIKDDGSNISSGEKSRIAIARSLLSNSSIFLMDEAFSSLDYKTAQSIERTLLDLKELTILNVSHIIFSDNKSSYDKIYIVKNNLITEL